MKRSWWAGSGIGEGWRTRYILYTPWTNIKLKWNYQSKYLLNQNTSPWNFGHSWCLLVFKSISSSRDRFTLFYPSLKNSFPIHVCQTHTRSLSASMNGPVLNMTKRPKSFAVCKYWSRSRSPSKSKTPSSGSCEFHSIYLKQIQLTIIGLVVAWHTFGQHWDRPSCTCTSCRTKEPTALWSNAMFPTHIEMVGRLSRTDNHWIRLWNFANNGTNFETSNSFVVIKEFRQILMKRL